MNQPLYKQYEKTEPIGVYCMSNFGGIEVLDIIDGGDSIIAAYNFGTRYCIRRHKLLYSNTGRPFFRKGQYRVYMDEVMRTAPV